MVSCALLSCADGVVRLVVVRLVGCVGCVGCVGVLLVGWCRAAATVVCLVVVRLVVVRLVVVR